MSRHDFTHDSSLEKFINILSALVVFILVAAIIAWTVITTLQK